jgi:hypothetical protein
MTLPARRWGIRAVLVAAMLASPCRAQDPMARDELLRLVPRDAGFCLIVNDLRGNADKLHDATWLKALRASPLGALWAASPEAAKLAKQEEDLKQHLQIDWPQFRDDILGDLLVFAYRPGPPDKPQDEDGVLLLWARKPEALTRVIERLNEVQSRTKQLKELTPVVHAGQKYFRRVEQDKTHFYFVHGSVLAFTSKEAIIRQVIEQHGRPAGHPLAAQLQRAHAAEALATVWLNPRAFDADLQRKAKQALAGEGQVLENFLTYWRALDAIVITLNVGETVEIKLSLQARAQDLPKSVRPLFTKDIARSDLWARFPAESILRIAGRLDLEALAETVAGLTPSSARSSIDNSGQRYLGAALGLDLGRDLLPNLGPDWGLCMAPGPAQSDIPLALTALAVRPGKKNVDQAVYKGAQLLATLLAWTYNSSHADAIRIQTAVLDNVEVKYLANDKGFPIGFQPAFALKDGYFLLASAPEAIRNFKKNAAPALPAGENPIAQLSMAQLSKFLKARQKKIVAVLADKNQIRLADAEQWFESLITGLDLFDHLLLSERREAGQVTWSLRLSNSR